MIDNTQPEALDLADWLAAVGDGLSTKRCAALLREQHTRIAELEQEVAHTDNLLGRANALASIRAHRIAELEAQLESSGFTAADMATSSAQGFRDGVASVAASAGSEPVAWTGGEEWERLAWHLCAEEHGEDACDEVIWEGGPIPEPWGARWMKYESDAKRMIELVRRFYTHPSPPEGAGWISVDERLPESDVPVLAHNGKWTGVAAWMSGDYLEPLERWQDEHREFIEMMGPAVTHWMPLPPPPTTSAGSGKGE